MHFSKKDIAKTIFLPSILPRLRELFGDGFSYFAYLIAHIYGMVRILPQQHPYLKPDAQGTFTVREVIRAASENIKFTRHNIDQIIIFFTIIAAIFILFIQFILFFIAFFVSTANAQDIPTKIEGFFKTNNPEEDLAFRILDLVFGHPDFFGSQDAGGEVIHAGLQSLLEIYSFGMLIVGAIIIIYFVITIASETAQTGVPFGKRFTHVWVPIRLILFFGLLIPISNGFNGGQYITLTMAKLGSGLATTGWTLFNDTVGTSATISGNKEHNVAEPKAPINALMLLPEFMTYAKICHESHKRWYNSRQFPASWKPGGAQTGIHPWAILKTSEKEEGKKTATLKYISVLAAKNSFQDLSAKTQGKEIVIVYGVKDESLYSHQRGFVEPVCGSISLKVSDISQPGSEKIQNGYLDLINNMWTDNGDLQKYAENFVNINSSVGSNDDAELPSPEYKQEWKDTIKKIMQDDDGLIDTAVKAQRESGAWEMPPEMRDYGWAGAAIWYNKIAEQNGALITAVHYTPRPLLLPRVMEVVRERKLKEDHNPDPKTLYQPTMSKGSKPIKFTYGFEQEIAATLGNAHYYWNKDKAEQNGLTGNIIIDTINAVLGTEGLFSICTNTDIHPLAQLSMVGKSILESSIKSFGLAVGATIFSIIPTSFSSTGEAFAGFFGNISSIGLIVGFMLFYIVPFMPFMYFFFAVASWIKTIFEAIVAMPLWALGHLRIDGDGLPGSAALNGYFLLFEIFIRPILIIIGLLAAISIFAAMVKVLNDIFYLAVSSVSGSDPEASTLCKTVTTRADKPELEEAYRGTIDQFFFTVVYTIFIFLIGNSCFKLIDNIPKQILRWVGAGTDSFLDNSGDDAEGLFKYVALAGRQFGGSLSSGISGLGAGARSSAQQVAGG